jgi:F-type H+-transporting ATPase subunit b
MISINATLIVQVINFLILMYILDRILFKPILRIVEEREKTVRDSKMEMSRLKDEAEKKAVQVETRLQDARRTAFEHRQGVVAEANKQADEIIGKALNKAHDHLASVKNASVKQATEVRESLSAYKGAIVEMVFAKVMGRKI